MGNSSQKFPQLDAAVIEAAPKFTYGRSANLGKSMNMDAMSKLWMATGALILYFVSQGVKVELVDVMQWKGRQKKETTIENCQRIYGAKVNDHTADAIMLADFFISERNILGRVKR